MIKVPELKEWENEHGQILTIGVDVKIKSSCEYYQPQYDRDGVYTVTLLFVDNGGLNIGINDGSDSALCDTDGFRISDIEPAHK